MKSAIKTDAKFVYGNCKLMLYIEDKKIYEKIQRKQWEINKKIEFKLGPRTSLIGYGVVSLFFFIETI